MASTANTSASSPSPTTTTTNTIDDIHYVNLWLQCLSGYSLTAFMDDVHSIESMPDDDRKALKYELRDSEAVSIIVAVRRYREKKGGDINDEEDSKTERQHSALEQFMNGLDVTERAIMEISSRMHHALCHHDIDEHQQMVGDDDDGEKFKVRSLKWSKKRDAVDPKTSKFVNEIADKKKESKSIDEGRMDELGGIIRRCVLTEGSLATLKGT